MEFVCCILPISGPDLQVPSVVTGKQEDRAQAHPPQEDDDVQSNLPTALLVFQSLPYKVKYKYLCEYKYMHEYWHDVDYNM